MPVYPIQDSFVRGEVSPRLHARAGLDLYKAALKTCVNFITLPHGGIRKRGGTYFVNQSKELGYAVRTIPFIYSRDQAYCLEVGDLYARVYAYAGLVLDGDDEHVEFTTPWDADDIGDLQFTQSADVMWVTHEDYPTQRISRLSAEEFICEEAEFDDGPFLAQNFDEAHTLYISHATGSGRTVTASAATFAAGDVGRLIRIDMETYEAIPPWEAGADLTQTTPSGKLTRYNGNVYECKTTQTVLRNYTGGTPPTHREGIELDGPGETSASIIPGSTVHVGMEWEYKHSGYGVALITGYTSPTVVTVTVLAEFPSQVVGSGNASYKWRLGAFGGDNGYPRAATISDERLTFVQRFGVYGSAVGIFDSFRTGSLASDAFAFQNASNEANEIVGIVDADGSLALLTGAGVRRLSGSGIDETLSPTSFKNRAPATARASDIQPIRTDAGFVYAKRAYGGIIELVASQNTFQTGDLGQISEHIFKRGVVRLAYQEEPDPIIWAPLANGEMGAVTYQSEQEVRGCHRHKIADGLALIEDCCLTPGLAGNDDLWLAVRITVQGVVRRYIVVVQPAFESPDLSAPLGIMDSFMVDLGLTYQGDPISAVEGLDHLEGLEVVALADGVVRRGLIVDGGAVSLFDAEGNPAPASHIHVGLAYTAEAETLELDPGGRDGTTRGRKKKLTEGIVPLLETANLEMRAHGREDWEPVENPTLAITDADAIPILVTDNIRVPLEDSWEGQCRVQFRAADPVPCTILAIVPGADSE